MRSLLLALGALGCAGDGGDADPTGQGCLDLPAECTPQYPPTFDQVWANTLQPSCALSGCHGGASAAGGLSLGDDADSAHAALASRVEPGDPACSALVDWLEPAGRGAMPPGAPLAEEERCAVRQWIADGAAR